MTKNKKILLAITLPVSAFLITIICLSLIYVMPFLIDRYKHRDWTILDYCEEQWEISLPKNNVEIQYNFSNRGGFLGDGTEYTICKYAVRPDDFLESFEKDNDGKYAQKYNNLLPMLQSVSMQNTYIDKSQLFTPDDNYIWMKKIMNGNCTLLLAYNEQNNTLYIIENFM